LAVALVTVVAAPVAAEVFTVALTSGSSFETRYRPIENPFDSGKVQFLTDTGNWISLDKSIVESIVAETESRGFGTVIDTQTIALGWDPTSLAAAEEAENAADPTTQLLNYLRERDRIDTAQPPPYSTQQFVEPAEAGGIPLWMSNQTTPPIGGTGGQ
jgi:hypothetical protein